MVVLAALKCQKGDKENEEEEEKVEDGHYLLKTTPNFPRLVSSLSRELSSGEET